jgi:ADP-ribosylglycohydrolase
MVIRADLQERIHAALVVAGIGDALGAPTEQYAMAEIAALHGPELIDRFIEPPADTFAGANGGRAGEITDDASQMYYLARALVKSGGRLTNADWIACLLDWCDTSPKAGFMGPSTEALVRALRAGDDPARFGRIGTSTRKMTNIGATNGAAMRVAPVGLCHPGDIDTTAEVTLQTCLPSHDASVAIEAACAIAAGVATALTARSWEEVVEGCREGGQRGRALASRHARLEAGPRFQARLEMALTIAASSRDHATLLSRMEAEVGNSVLAAESVPCAIGLFAYAKGDPWLVVRLAASIGNDSDSIGTMAGAMAGALSGFGPVPPSIVQDFHTANPGFDLVQLAYDLARIGGAGRG